MLNDDPINEGVDYRVNAQVFDPTGSPIYVVWSIKSPNRLGIHRSRRDLSDRYCWCRKTG